MNSLSSQCLWNSLFPFHSQWIISLDMVGWWGLLSTLEIHTLFAFIFSDKKSTIILILVSLKVLFFFFSFFQDILSLVFWRIIILMIWWVLVCFILLFISLSVLWASEMYALVVLKSLQPLLKYFFCSILSSSFGIHTSETVL